MKILNFDVFYKDFYDEACLSYKQTEYLKTIDKNKSVLNEISSEKERIIKNCISKGKHDFLNQYDLKIKNVFKHPIKETFINLYSNNKSNSNDINIRSFQSTLTIFDELTEISEKICKLKDDQFEVLVTEVNKINNNLPSNGYVPFLKESVRNYLIVHIPISQLRIFKTKNRAPFLIQFELVRIDEINKALRESYSKQSSFNPGTNFPASNILTSKSNKNKKKLKIKSNYPSPFTNQIKSYAEEDSDNSSNDGLTKQSEEEDNSSVPTFEEDIEPRKRGATISKFGEGLSFETIENYKHKSDTANTSNVSKKTYDKPIISINSIRNSVKSNSSSSDKNEENKHYIIDPKEIKSIKKNRASTLKLLIESDIKVSKPLTIMDLDSHYKKFIKDGKIIMEQDIEEDSLIAEQVDEKIDKAIAESISNNKFAFDPSKIEVFENNFHEDNKKRPQSKSFYSTNSGNRNSNEDIRDGKNNVFIHPVLDDDRNVYLEEEENRMDSGESSLNMKHKTDFLLVSEDFNYETDFNNTYVASDLINNKTEIKGNDGKEKSNDIYKIKVEYKKESMDIFGSAEEEASLRHHSPFGNYLTWRTFKCIIKSGEDLRQEQFASQLINLFNQIFKIEKVNCWVNPYEVISTGNGVGIIECVNHAMSLDSLKKKMSSSNLKEFFVNYFGGKSDVKASQESKQYQAAVNNFIRSLAGNCLVSYFLQIKDRHNGNILLDNQGHLIHIDFGFMFTIAPGKGIQFEKAPFKLTSDFVQVMDGVNSKYFQKFRKLLWKGFVASVKHAERIIILVEMMLMGHGDSLPCFTRKDNVLDELRERFYPFARDNKLKNPTKTDFFKHVDSLIELSIDNWRTKWYDKYQYYFQGIFY